MKILIALLCFLPLGVAAQNPAPPPEGTSSVEPTQQNNSRGSARHLDEAARILKTVSDSSLKSDGKEKLTEFRKHFAELVSAYDANPDPFLPPILSSDVNSKGEEKVDTTNWKEAFTQVENDLANILGGGDTPPEPAPPGSGAPVNSPAPVPSSPDNTAVGTTGQVGQSPDATPATPAPVVNTTPVPVQTAPAGTINAGLLAGAIGIKNLDPEVRRQLEQVRLNVELFFAATTLNLEGEAAR